MQTNNPTCVRFYKSYMQTVGECIACLHDTAAG